VRFGDAGSCPLGEPVGRGAPPTASKPLPPGSRTRPSAVPSQT